MDLEPDPVIQEVSDPWILGKDQAALLNHIRDEYQDRDGDWAAGFITADLPPNTPKKGRFVKDWKDVDGRRAEGSHKLDKNFHERPWERSSFDEERKGHSTVQHPTESEERHKGIRGSKCSSKSVSKQKQFQEAFDYLHHIQEEHQARSGKRLKEVRRASTKGLHFSSGPYLASSDSAQAYCIELSDDEMEQVSFTCSLCDTSCPLPLSYPMPNCICLFCEFCITKYAEMHITSMVSSIKGQTTTSGSERVQESSMAFENIACPGEDCNSTLPVLSCQELAPGAFSQWEEIMSSTILLASDGPFVTCPTCGVAIETVPSELPPGVALSGVPEIDRTAPYVELDGEGVPLSRHAMCHRLEHCYRCPACSNNFCDNCRLAPYHLGKNCEEHKQALEAGNCLYCDQQLTGVKILQEVKDKMSVHELRRELDRRKADASWCVEKSDLRAVLRMTDALCSARDCQRQLSKACTRPLACGHFCLGIRGESACPPCLQESCLSSSTSTHLRRPAANRPAGELPSAEDYCPICGVEPLKKLPCIQLACGHVMHHDCAREKVAQGAPGPELSFTYLRCPLCSKEMQHVSLDTCMKKGRHLKSQVEEKALARLQADGILNKAPELRQGGQFVGRPLDFALHQYRFYECFKCREPYFGGERQCEADGGLGGDGEGAVNDLAHDHQAAGNHQVPRNKKRHPFLDIFSRLTRGRARGNRVDQAPDGANPQDESVQQNGNAAPQVAVKEQVCGSCIAKSVGSGPCVRGHGTTYTEYKCQFCCSVATYFCFGTTHFCNICHTVRPDAQKLQLSSCRGGPNCPLKVPHPPSGEEFCLGCALCRLEKGG